MDRNLDIDNFERLLKDRSEEFKMYPTKRVWHSIYNNIHPGRKWPSIAMCIVLISILLLVGYLNTSDTAGNFATVNSTKPSPLTSSINSYNAIFYNNFLETNKPDNNFAGQFFKNNFTSITTGDASGSNVDKMEVTPAINTVTIPYIAVAGIKRNEKNPDDKVLTLVEKTIPINKSNTVNTIPLSEDNATVKTATNEADNDKRVTGSVNPATSGAITKTIASDLAIAKNEQLASFTNHKPSVTAANNFNQNIVLIGNDGNFVVENNDISALKSTATTAEIVGIKKDKDQQGNEKTTENADETSIASVTKASPGKKNNTSANTAVVLSDADKAWVENYALYNRPVPKKWAGKLGWQLYFTPSVVYRNLRNVMPSGMDINKEVSQHPSIGFEIGSGIIYPIFKGVRIKTGLQLNFTRYNTDAFENSHPVATSITLNDEGQYYHASRTTPFSNNGGITPVKLHNDTYQVSIPIGVDFKILGNDNLQWNVGTTIQPAYVFGGKSYLISSDKRNFIKETSLLNRWNLDAGFETFISYKVHDFTFQFGPQFRKQIFTTNSKIYTVEEKLNNYGIKFGITKLIK